MQSNPFDMSNMGLNQENPLFTSMNIMRQMWDGMATNPLGMSSSSATAMPSAEDLDKRIKELRAVENWLRLNLSMLSSTIQGLEIQRSTLSTLQSFAQNSMAAMPGLAEAMNPTASSSPAPIRSAAPSKEAEVTDEATESLMQAGQAWWGMMQQQFETIAQATTQSMQQTQSASSTIPPSAVPNPSADTTFGKEPAAKAVAKKATKKTTKTTPKSTPPTK